ncbi:hypothetical protein L0664_13780 [Octadecabacter sp. G9-8]|uniref:Transferrin-binding protein B C-lobe/N-lobe beta barrel domain-containing protein n=1 Tax=Octadecabacter dasysiphoniae TaxID=2909341 RepID=A0ABS9CZ16_9RHOB|nr:hypothetical protein [Octadecabacter dasysiphoniae]MCF2872141.1 hypothetical protein [Octadecabacter dasysiphoniae]
MVHVCIPPALILATGLSLSACGDIKGALEFADTRDDFLSRRATLEDRSNTAYLGVPETGEATYRGEASLAVGTKSDGVVLLGDAAITVDFDDSTLSGEMGNFSGFDTNEDFSKYAGVLVLEDGVIGAVNPNDVEGQIVGVLTGDGNVIGVDAFWEGHLKGTPIIGILGDTTPGSSTFTLNDDVVPGTLVTAVTD